MNKYLYRISTKRDTVWSRSNPKPIYFVANSKEDAIKWAESNLQNGLAVAKVICLAEAVAGSVFIGC